MARATVFVDDAVLGRLPALCAKGGVPTADRLRLVEEVGQAARLGVLWLLLLAGPLGWLLLAVLAGRSRGERLEVEVPFSAEAYGRLRAARRARRVALAAGGLAVVGLVWLAAAAGPGPAGVVVALLALAGAAVAALAAGWRLDAASVGVELDASRRWVTLTGVHPAFAAACQERAAAAPRR